MGFLASAINVGQPACRARAGDAQKAMRPLPRTGQRPQTKKTLPVWAKVSLTTLPLSTWPERLLVLTTTPLRRLGTANGRRSSYSPLEGRPESLRGTDDFYHGWRQRVN